MADRRCSRFAVARVTFAAVCRCSVATGQLLHTHRLRLPSESLVRLEAECRARSWLCTTPSSRETKTLVEQSRQLRISNQRSHELLLSSDRLLCHCCCVSMLFVIDSLRKEALFFFFVGSAPLAFSLSLCHSQRNSFSFPFDPTAKMAAAVSATRSNSSSRAGRRGWRGSDHPVARRDRWQTEADRQTESGVVQSASPLAAARARRHQPCTTMTTPSAAHSNAGA